MESSTSSPKSNRFGWVIRYAVPAVLAVIFCLFLARTPLTSRWVDFPVYFAAGRKAVAARTVYNVAGHFQYKYSPLIALLFGGAFSFASFTTASWIFQKTMLLLWAVFFWNASGRRLGATLLLVLLFGNALKLDLELGQVNALVAVLLWSLLTRLESPRSSWAKDLLYGIGFAFAVQLKLFALILVPVLLLRGQYRKLAFGLVLLPLLSVGVVALYSDRSFSFAENLAWIRSLTASTDELLLDDQNIAILGTFGKGFGLELGKILWMLCGVGFLVALIQKRGSSLEWFRSRSFAAIAFLNPLVWSYWILFLVPLASELRVPDRRGFRILGGVAALYVFAAFSSQHAKWAWNGGILAAMFVVLLFVLGKNRNMKRTENSI